MSQAVDAPALLELRGIRKGFGGVTVLHGVDVRVGEGEILALLGENGAGKSTLVKMIVGMEPPDEGEITIAGARQDKLTPQTTHALGVRYISQEITDAGSLSVAENVSLGRLGSRFGFVRWKAVRERARRVFAELGIDFTFDDARPVETLSLGERQLIEIARAVSDEVRLLILDEPTAALPENEVGRLFALLRRLRDRGVGMIYITHRLDEVQRIADSVQVLRDGRTALKTERTITDASAIVEVMVGGREHGGPAPEGERRERHPDAEPAVFLQDARIDGAFAPLTLRAYPGEMLMLYGKLGSGASEVIRAISGDAPLHAGTLHVHGRPIRKPSPRTLIDAGVGIVPIDRKGEGLFEPLPVMQNLAAVSWRRLAGRSGVVRRQAESAVYERWRGPLKFRNIASPALEVSRLSGGNQQKVMLGRWLERGVRVLALAEPTRGVDIAARREIYTALRRLTVEGRSVIAATSDVEEVVECADRVIVMSRGEIVGELAGQEITAQALTRLAVA